MLDKREILRDVSLVFSPGLNYLVGLNGSGKTTLLNIISGSIPFEGEVKIADMPLSGFSSKSLSKLVAIVPQRLDLAFPVNVFDFVLMGRFPYLGWLGEYSPHDKDIATFALEKMKMADFRERDLQSLSGGEFQRVLIARGLSQETDIILLDEPAQSLDPLGKEEVYQILEGISGEGKTVICTTHDRYPMEHQEASFFGLNGGKLVLTEKGSGMWEKVMEKVYRS